MSETDIDVEQIKMLSSIVSKANKQTEEAELQVQKTDAEIEALQSQPSGEHVQRQIREKVNTFLALPNRSDREVRNAFNDWV